MMSILLLFFLILGCSVANGLVFVGLGFPWNLVSMLLCSGAIVWSLVKFQKLSKDWKKSDDIWDSEAHHARPFTFMFSLSLAVFAMALLIFATKLATESLLHIEGIRILVAVLVSSLSATVSYGVAGKFERKYADGVLFDS